MKRVVFFAAVLTAWGAISVQAGKRNPPPPPPQQPAQQPPAQPAANPTPQPPAAQQPTPAQQPAPAPPPSTPAPANAGSDSEDGEGPKEPPKLNAAFSPKENSKDVDIDSPVGVALAEEIDCTQVGPETLVVTSAAGKRIAGTVGCEEDGVVFVPSRPLHGKTTYKAVLRNLKDEDKRPYPELSWSFETGVNEDEVPPPTSCPQWQKLPPPMSCQRCPMWICGKCPRASKINSTKIEAVQKGNQMRCKVTDLDTGDSVEACPLGYYLAGNGSCTPDGQEPFVPQKKKKGGFMGKLKKFTQKLVKTAFKILKPFKPLYKLAKKGLKLLGKILPKGLRDFVMEKKQRLGMPPAKSLDTDSLEKVGDRQIIKLEASLLKAVQREAALETLLSGKGADASVQKAQEIAGYDNAKLAKLSGDTLARALFLLEVEAPGSAGSFKSKIQAAKTAPVFGAPLVFVEAEMYHQLYDMPCSKPPRRDGKSWPPRYGCDGAPLPTTEEPTPVVTLDSAPSVVTAKLDPNPAKEKEDREDAELANQRQQAFADRDALQLPTETLAKQPAQYCVKSQCFKSYNEVLSALYPKRPADSLPVFCAPAREGKGFSTDKVECTKKWLMTQRYEPWDKDGNPAPKAADGVIPDYACFASKHLTEAHMKLPGSPNSAGFYCRKRIFRVLVKIAEKSVSDRNRNIARTCAEMRDQVWGEQLSTLDELYDQWCKTQKGRAEAGLCPSGSGGGKPIEKAPDLPYMYLTREELLYFFGHRELFCRADRRGLVHFLRNEKWADTFTCDVPRGVIETGPFEEGVQACSLVPWAGEESRAEMALAEPGAKPITDDHLRSRLHCYKFNRPTCEDQSKEKTLADLPKNNPFDVYDSLRETRRTHDARAWAYKDIKDAEKLGGWQEKVAFGDGMNDEGDFGVRDFCRFVGATNKIQCGYKKEEMAAWYELRKSEAPEGCEGGVCTRGAFKRGYLCGIFQSPEYFAGKLQWICGIDSGLAGQKLIQGSKALCVGGERALHFHSARGDRSSLKCFSRRFRWVDTSLTRSFLRGVHWARAVVEAAQVPARFPNMLLALPPAKVKKHRKQTMMLNNEVWKQVVKRVATLWEQDAQSLVKWANERGHEMGHRTSLRVALMKSGIPVIQEFKNLKIQTRDPKRADRLTKMLDDVRAGDQPGDARWFHDFMNEAAPGGVPSVSCGQAQGQDPAKNALCPFEVLSVVLRTHHIFNVLKSTQKSFLRYTNAYAQVILSEASKVPLLTRIELLEAAQQSPNTTDLKANVFCVEATPETEGSPSEILCTPSPLFIAGMVEKLAPEPQLDPVNAQLLQPNQIMGGGKKAFKNFLRAEADRLGKIEEAKELALLNQEKWHDKRKNRVRFGWCYGGLEGMPVFGVEPLAPLKESTPGSPYLIEPPAFVVDNGNSNRNWMKCSRFAFSDESWELVDPKMKAIAKKGGGKGGGGALVTMIMGLIGPVVNTAGDALSEKTGGASKALAQVVNAALEAIQHFADMFKDVAEKQWNKEKEKLDAKMKVIDQKKDALVERSQNLIGLSGEKLKEEKAAIGKMEAEIKELEKAYRDDEKEAKKVMRKPSGTGALVNRLTDELSNAAGKGLSILVAPFAGKVMVAGVKMVKQIVDPVSQALIAAVGSIPFVGGALAVAVETAYDEGMNALAQMGTEKVAGVLERVFSKLARALLGPILQKGKKAIGKLAFAACKAHYGELCEPTGDGEVEFSALPRKDAWLDRVIACKPSFEIETVLAKKAAEAREEIARRGQEMMGAVPHLTRQIANEQLARFGYTYDSWMAAYAREPKALEARGAEIAAAIERHLGRGGRP
jgi:hypothetical protein